MLAVGAVVDPKLIALRKKREKAASPTSVFGKIVAVDAERQNEKVTQFGGCEMYLSLMAGHGPCLCVKNSKHKPGQASCMSLSSFRRFLGDPETGKVTIEIAYRERRRLLLFVDISSTLEDVENMGNLKLLKAQLEDQSQWRKLEINAGQPQTKESGRRRGRGDSKEENLAREIREHHTDVQRRDSHLGMGKENVAAAADDDDDDDFEYE